MPYGEMAALGTALCWAFTAVFFTAAGERIGSLSVNLIRLVMALFMLAAYQWFSRGLPLPTDATAHAWAWLSVSGLIGFCIGDLCLFRALLVIGPRLASLLMALAPVLAALLGFAVLGERLGWRELVGIVLTVGGIAWAIGDRTPSHDVAAESVSTRRKVIGIALGLGGAAGQAGGLVLSKLGMGEYDAFAATQIRVIAGTVGFAVIFFFAGWWPRTIKALAHRPAMAYTAGGAFFGPFLGVSLSLIAVQKTYTGVAAALMATTPILVIPTVVLIRRERVGIGGIAGAVIAVAGVIVLVTT